MTHFPPRFVMLASLLLSAGSIFAEDKAPATAASTEAPAEATPSPEEFYQTQVKPLLTRHCADCHGEDSQESGLRLDTLEWIARGGESGPLFQKGVSEGSVLLSALSHEEEGLKMPPDEKLPKEEIAVFEKWVAIGLPDEVVRAAEMAVSGMDPEALAEARKFWAFKPVARPKIPEVVRKDWVATPIDAFILHRLEQKKLSPVDAASRRALIRRATFDLTGLPPTPEEVEDFVQDQSDNAWPKVVNRLLASPHYGERWGRHWLDVVRYADSNGLDENIAHGNAWRYRDYVIEAFNGDLPYNEFLRQQVAGDLYSEQETDLKKRHNKLIATGFLTLGPKVLAEGDKEKLNMDIVDEQLDTIGRAFLGLTIGCARCHDHKFDPISTADYYALAGIFKSTRTMESLKTIARWHENTIAQPEELASKAAHDKLVEAKKAEIAEFTKTANAELAKTVEKLPAKPETAYPAETKKGLEALRAELKKLEGEAPVLPTAMGVMEGDAANVPIHVRGSHRALGRMVPRGFPVVLRAEDTLAIPPEDSGRREFAEWLVDPDHPLTARVMVNRMWRWHFGRGLVPTTDNFGHLGMQPEHPELLDWLAAEFIDSNWSVKSLHRTIMLSNTYQLSSDLNAAQQVDPENLFWWRNDVRRLEAEAIRDSLLAISNRLDTQFGGSLLHVKNRAFLFDHTSKDTTSYDSLRRSVYLPVIRNNLYDGFSLFDFTDSSVPNGNRGSSTIAPQALFLMNSPLVIDSAKALAERLAAEVPNDSSQRVKRLYELAYGRPPEAQESDRILTVVEQFTKLPDTDTPAAERERDAWAAVCQMVLASNEFLYIE